MIDEPSRAFNNLKEIINGLDQELELSFNTEKDESLDPQNLIFISTDFPEWESKIEALSESCDFLILCSYDLRHALIALDLQLFGFLLRPFSRSEVTRVLQRHAIALNDWNPSFEQLKPPVLSKLNEKKTKYYGISLNDSIRILQDKQIVRIEADNNYSVIHTSTGEKLMSAKPLKYFEQNLESSVFVRVHKSHIVNMNEIIEYSKKKGGIVILKDSTEIVVSRRKRNELMGRLVSF